MATGSKKVIYAAMAGNGLIAITKFIAAGITGSSAMLSEGIHSVVDTGNQCLLLYGLHRAKLPADERFPFGHGKEVYFWCFIVAILIFAVGAGVSIYEGILHILDPKPISSPIISYVVLGLAMVFEGFAWLMAFKEFSRSKGTLGYLQAVSQGKDPTLFVVLFEDSAAMAGLVVAFLGIWLSQVTGIAWFDGLASVLIGCILGATAAWLAYETKSLLIGESANPHVVKDIREFVARNPRVTHVNEVLTMHMGPEYILVNLSVDFADATTAHDMEITIAAMDREIKRLHPEVKRVYIEAESRRVIQ
jgi:cation diffusion facilitator family transporter